jgi:protein-disulfide isomerase
MEGRKTLVWTTLATALLVFTGAVIHRMTQKETPLIIQTENFPSFGKSSAEVQVVLIEDFQCKNCRAFSKKVIPKLQAHYIKPGKVRFTLIPVSFLAGSQQVANAALEVYHQAPDQFFSYLNDLLGHEGELKRADLVRLARRIARIDLEKFQNCIEKGCHNQELEKNLDWARQRMGSQFRTPALFINGSAGSTYSFEAIQYQIEQIIEKS